MSFAATRKDVGSYPFRRGLTSQGSMNPGRAPRWSSAHCPRGVPAMKMTPLQASNLKQEDNLRPKKVYTRRTIRQKRRSVRVFPSSPDNHVADPLAACSVLTSPELHVQIRPPKETTTDTQPGNLVADPASACSVPA
ncbi:hypothetical protein MTP99_001321 [Tenebrio molitor]|nr:hypothetical protein MTP99_001321 [Tenebrio molitor]